MDPNDLRDCVEQAIVEFDRARGVGRCEIINQAEQESLRGVLASWRGA